MPTVITISEFSIPECNFKGTTCKLRRYYDSEWTDIDGVLHEPGSIGSSTDFFDEIDCTLEDNTITVPAFDASPSINARIGSPRETWQLWDQAGSARNVIAENWFIPSSPTSTTRDALAIANQGQSLQNPISTYLNALQVQQLIDAVIGALRFATSVIAGWVRLSVPAVSAVDPIAVGDNDPRVTADQAVNVASIRTLGAGPLQAAEGNDPRIPSAGAYYYALNYASFAAAVAAMGTTVPVRLIVSEQMAVAADVLVTPNIQLEFVGNGKLIVAANKTVTIQGPLIIPPGKQVFDTTAIGSAVTITGATYALSSDVPNFTIYSHNYASFNLAEAAIEALGGGTLVVDDLSQVSATIVVPSNVSIVFSGAGVLGALSGGKTVTFQGPLTAPPWFIFSSVLTISFSGNTSVSVLDTRWWGALWDDTNDDTAAIQAAIDAMQPHTALVVPSNGYAKTTAPLRIWSKHSPKFFSEANAGPFLNDSNGPGIDYRGADGSAAIQWYNVLGGAWDGIGVSFNHDANVAQTGIDIDQFPDGTVIGGRAIAGATCTANTFKHFGMNTDNNGVNTTGIRLAFTSNNNCENMTFERVNVVINGTNSAVSTNLNRGVAFKIGGGGGGANAFNLRFDSVSWTFATYGIQSFSGSSGIITSGESQRASIDFKLSGSFLIQDFRPENGRQFLYGFGQITLIENQINGAWDPAFPVVYVAGSTFLQMIGNVFSTDATAVAVDADPAGNCQFAGMGNLWPDSVPPTLANFSIGAISLGHRQRLAMLVGGQTSVIRLGSAIPTSSLPTVQYGDGTLGYVSDAAPGSVGPTGGAGAPVARINGAWQALGQNVVSTVVAPSAFGVPGGVPGMVETAEIVGPSGGCGFGDRLVVGAPVAVGANYILSAYVSSTNHFKIRWTQIAGAAADPNAAGGTYVVTVWR